MLVHYAALVIAVLVWQILRDSGMVTSIGFAIGAAGAAELAVLLFVRASRSRTERLDEALARLERMSVDEARLQAIEILSESRQDFQKTPVPPELAISQREFFMEYGGLQIGDGTAVDLTGFGPSRWLPGYVKIGGNGTNEIVTKAGEDRIWEVDGPLTAREIDSEAHPSIWHYVVASLGPELGGRQVSE